MWTLEQMKAHAELTAEDEALLIELWPYVASEREAILDAFYAAVFASPKASALIADTLMLARLRRLLSRWLEELFRGPHDANYYESRSRIGQVHVALGLPDFHMFSGMSVVRQRLFRIARAVGNDRADAMCDAIDRLTTIDLAITTAAYNKSHETQQLETLQQLMVAHLPVSVLLVGVEGRINAVTHAATRLFGTQVGQPWRDGLPKPLVEAAELERHVPYCIETKRSVALLRVDCRLDGDDRSFRVDVVPLEQPHASVLLHVEDLTEAIHTESRMREAEGLARLGAMATAIAHELRNPLAGISGALQVISGTFPAEDGRKVVLDKVEGQIQRLNALVTDLLAFARPDPPKLESVDLAEIAREVIDAAAAPGLAMRVDGSGTALADRSSLKLVLEHLVENAAMATKGQGQIVVLVSAGQLLINDSGPGVPPELAERIFEPFFTTRSKGTGLGLAISRRAVASMGGDLRLGTGPLTGAAFFITLRRP